MEQETAIPAMDEATQKSKCAFFPPFNCGRGTGFELSVHFV